MDADIQAILSANTETVGKALDNFIKNTSQTFTFPQLDENTRKELWKNLYDVASNTNDHTILIKIFSSLRILSREKPYLNQLVTKEWLSLIQHRIGFVDEFTFNSENTLVAVEALKSLCNIVFNSFVVAKNCCEIGILENIVKRIGKYGTEKFPDEIKFFDMKVLFLISAVCPHIRSELKGDLKADTYMINTLEGILKEASENKSENGTRESCLTDKQVDLICELLKGLFNLTLHADGTKEEDLVRYKYLVGILRNLLMMPTNDLEKTWMIRNNVVNLLTNMPPESYDALMVSIENDQSVPNNLKYDDINMSAIYEILMLLKAKFNETSTTSNRNELLSPIMTVLLKGANHIRPIRKYLKINVLPPLRDVHTRPEQGTTLRNNLSRLLTTPIPQLRYLTSEFLFVLCKKNVTRMVKYTGYGNAAGLFAQRGLLGGRRDEAEGDYSSDSGDSETEEYAEHKHGINPVLGCYEEPHPNPMENMTEEQKEYEAMKLVELMDSLTKCGTIKPCRIGADGKPQPIEHVLQLQEGLRAQQTRTESDSD